VAGDAIDLRAKLKAETTALLATQSSTKVYLSPDQRVSRQTLGAELHDRATLIVWPDPVVAFARSRYSQHQIFGLAPSANLILLDWYTSGRHARGERWQASAFESRNEIFVDGKRAALDAIRISPTSPSLFGNYDCFATLFFVGPALVETAKEIVEWARHEPVARRSELIFSASALCCGGAVIRVGGKSVEQVGAFLQSKCGVVPQLLGDNPWSRKR
jgi:urease accessory protein